MRKERVCGRVFGCLASGILLLLGALVFPAWGQELEWARLDGSDEFDWAHGIAVDREGNSYVTGSIEASAAFGRGEEEETVLHSFGEHLFFLAKYAWNGRLLWARQATGGHSPGRDVAVDGEGNSYVTGEFEHSAFFGSGENATELTTDDRSTFVAKYDPEGTLLWARQIDPSLGGTGIHVDEAGNIYLTGYGFLIAKYADDGTLLWVSQDGPSSGSAIAGDGEGTIYVTGSFSDTIVFGAGEPTRTELTSMGGQDMFLAKYTSEGRLLWVTQAGGNTAGGLGVAVNSSGNSFVTGYFTGEATFGLGETVLTSSGDRDIFVAKYDRDGALVWAQGNGTAGEDFGNDIALDEAGNLFVLGFYVDQGDFFVDKYAEDGRLLWSILTGRSSTDICEASSEDCFLGQIIDDGGVGIDGTGSVYVAGTLNGPVTFGAGDDEITLGDFENNYDVFVARYSQNDVQDLISLIGSFDLPKGIENSLLAKLRNVQKALESPNANQRAANILQAFINEVEAQRGLALTEEQAEELVASAQEILSAL